ncbi:hypothetical protein CROQUDRAFT_132752 [Cronartium quercuum f. sp. fusiforme G11]|uniref:Uncharacterized protein n=1 Tax=Cronartium quercuum f. sp. fusiforme G11 TaxID=708437 RepID=A0A9P6NHH4_9BASI|nr:hypothetical protein CROQUDRAFT_132752 [Cronartium quercuum f. sp. fusiforme G11]
MDQVYFKVTEDSKRRAKLGENGGGRSILQKKKKCQQEDEPCNVWKLALWTLLQFSSQRGLQFDWGPSGIANTHNATYFIRRLYLINLPHTLALAFIVKVRDSPSGTTTSALLSKRIPNFYGLNYLSESFCTVCFGIYMQLAR